MAAAKEAWPSIVNGVSHGLPPAAKQRIGAAGESAARLQLPDVLGERQAAALTGPAAGIAGLYRAFSELSTRSWPMLLSMLSQIEGGTPSAARFARSTLPLYIDAIYDAHFSLAQIGKKLDRAYRKLGGARGFGASLSEAQVSALETTYSEGRDKLEPHVEVKLGS